MQPKSMHCYIINPKDVIIIKTNDKDLSYYQDLINSKSYGDAVCKLIHKNGKNEYSYKSNSKAKKKKAFYLHHIMECCIPNIGNKSEDKVGGQYQNDFDRWKGKDYLVNCDLVEHLILHVLILTDKDYYDFDNKYIDSKLNCDLKKYEHKSEHKSYPYKCVTKNLNYLRKKHKDNKAYAHYLQSHDDFEYCQFLIKYDSENEYDKSGGANSLLGKVINWYSINGKVPEVEANHKDKCKLSSEETLKLIEQINDLVKSKQSND